MEEIKNKAHYIAVTGIIRNSEGKYLICKRSPQEKAFPEKWCVPGGKIEAKDFINTPKDTSSHWLNIFEKVLRKEIKDRKRVEKALRESEAHMKGILKREAKILGRGRPRVYWGLNE